MNKPPPPKKKNDFETSAKTRESIMILARIQLQLYCHTFNQPPI